MKIYDAHMHLGGSAKPDPKQLIGKLSSCGVYGGGLFSIDPENPDFTYEERMDNLFAWVEGYEDRLFPFAWLHPYEDDVLDKVRDCARRGVAGFKFIASNYFVHDEKPKEVFRLIEELNLPIFFHTGILWDFNDSIDYNRPGNWESFMHYKKLKFCMCHCSYPWYDECLMLRGKFDWMRTHAERAANGIHTIHANYPWVKEHVTERNGERVAEMPELYLDTTPGANGLYREDLLKKIYYLCPHGNNIMYGSDLYVETYQTEVTTSWLSEHKRIFDALNVSEEFRRNYFSESFLRFIGK